MNSEAVLLIVLVVNFYVCLEGYFFIRSFFKLRVFAKRKKPVTLIYWFFSTLLSAAYFYACHSSGSLRSTFGMASSYWGLVLLALTLLFSDIAAAAVKFIKRKAAGNRPVSSHWALIPAIRLSALLLALLIFAAGFFAARYAKITAYNITLEKPLPGNELKVVMISDIHIGAMIHKKQLGELVEKINGLEADIVLIAGDILDRNIEAYKNENMGEEMSRINARLGVFAVTGNHDYFGENINELKEELSKAGIRLLVDEAVLVDNSFYVIGRNDSGRRGNGRKSLAELTENLDGSLPFLLMDHQPLNLSESENSRIDLQMSGHTHNGQVFPVNLFIKGMYENSYGLYYRGKTAVVVSSGCGTWGPPIRLGTRSEIVMIKLAN